MNSTNLRYMNNFEVILDSFYKILSIHEVKLYKNQKRYNFSV